MAARLEGADEALLLGRRDPAEHRVRLRDLAERRPRRGRPARCPRWRRRRPRPAWRASATTVSGSSPEMILTLTPAAANDASDRTGLGAQLVCHRDEAEGTHARRAASRRRRRRAAAARRRRHGVATSRTRRPRSVQRGRRSLRARPSRRARRRRPSAREGRRNVGAPSAMIARQRRVRVRRTRPRSTCGPTRTAPRRPAGSGSRGQRAAIASVVWLRTVADAGERRQRGDHLVLGGAVEPGAPPRPRAGSRSACRSCRGTARRRGSATRSRWPAGPAPRSGGSGSRPGRRRRRSTRTGRWGRGRRAASRRRRRRPGPRRLDDAAQDEQDLEVDHDPQHDPDHEVDLGLERRDHAPERPGAGGDPVREAAPTRPSRRRSGRRRWSRSCR